MSRKGIPRVAVVGRPNVGKSTFFNRIVPRGDAVVDDMPGVTRDRREGDAAWNAVPFRLIDTGGLVPGTHDSMEAAILEQGDAALEEADAILFLIDAREGITAVDEAIAARLRPLAAAVFLVANKVETEAVEIAALDATRLGLGAPFPISAQHGRGVGDLLDVLVARLPRREVREEDVETVRIALLGRPNVGKSSLANRLIGKARFIVHDEPGTTRDAVDAEFRYDGTRFVLVDTAGLRRRSHVTEGVEFYSTLRTRRSLERSDVALLVIDAAREVAVQDAHIAGAITEAGKSMIFLVNKWDLIEKTTGTSEAFVKLLRDKFPLLAGSPVLFVSALSGQRVQRIPEEARRLYRERAIRVPTARLNELLKEACERVQPPTRIGRKPLKLYYVTQTGESPPVFTVFVNDPASAGDSYRKYLRNFYREALELTATPLRLEFRARR